MALTRQRLQLHSPGLRHSTDRASPFIISIQLLPAGLLAPLQDRLLSWSLSRYTCSSRLLGHRAPCILLLPWLQAVSSQATPLLLGWRTLHLPEQGIKVCPLLVSLPFPALPA